MQKGDSKGGAEQHVFDGAAYTQTDPAGGSTEPGAASDIYTVVSLRCVTALDPFPTVTEAQVHRPAVGSSLTLSCDPPHSYPPGIVYWGEKSGPQLRPLEDTDRVSHDYEGGLASRSFFFAGICCHLR